MARMLARMSAKSGIKYCRWLCSATSEAPSIQNGFFLQERAVEFKLLSSETGSGSAFRIPTDSLDFLSKYRLISSSNGILLLRDVYGRQNRPFMVCNPVTREYALLPKPEGFEIADGGNMNPLIQCSPQRHEDIRFPYDYTLAVPIQVRTPIPSPLYTFTLDRQFMSFTHHQEAIKYGLLICSDGIWEKELFDVSIEGRFLRHDMPVAMYPDTADGLVVHYLCDSNTRTPTRYSAFNEEGPYMDPFIVAFDARQKKLIRQIELPEEACTASDMNRSGTYGRMWIDKWNKNSIILVKWHRFAPRISAWVLDNYGREGESWRLVMNKSQMELWGDYNWDWTNGVGVASGRGLLFATTPAYINTPKVFNDLKSRVFLYALEGENEGKMEVVGDHKFDHCEYISIVPYSYNTLSPVSVQNAWTYYSAKSDSSERGQKEERA